MSVPAGATEDVFSHRFSRMTPNSSRVVDCSGVGM